MAENREDKITVKTDTQPLDMSLSECAVLVVDMQNAFLKKGGYFDVADIDISGPEAIIKPCRKIIETARKRGVRIIYLQMGYSPDLTDKGPPESPYALKARVPVLLKQRPELKEKLYIYGTWGAEIIDELRPRKGDIIIKKQRYDGFMGTNLDITLRTLGIKYLFFIGIATNVCVESTLRRAFFLDYFPILVTDAVCQKGPEILQEATILNVRSTFGWVTNCDSLVRDLNRR